jgi:hypothetical protein
VPVFANNKTAAVLPSELRGRLSLAVNHQEADTMPVGTPCKGYSGQIRSVDTRAIFDL